MTNSNINVNVANELVNDVLNATAKVNNAQARMSAYLFADAIRYDAAFCTGYLSLKGEDKTKDTDTILKSMSEHYASLLVMIENIQEQKKQSPADKIKVAEAKAKRQAVRIMFERAVTMLAGIHGRNASKVTVNKSGAVRVDFTGEEGETYEMLSNAALMTEGKKAAGLTGTREKKTPSTTLKVGKVTNEQAQKAFEYANDIVNVMSEANFNEEPPYLAAVTLLNSLLVKLGATIDKAKGLQFIDWATIQEHAKPIDGIKIVKDETKAA